MARSPRVLNIVGVVAAVAAVAALVVVVWWIALHVRDAVGRLADLLWLLALLLLVFIDLVVHNILFKVVVTRASERNKAITLESIAASLAKRLSVARLIRLAAVEEASRVGRRLRNRAGLPTDEGWNVVAPDTAVFFFLFHAVSIHSDRVLIEAPHRTM